MEIDNIIVLQYLIKASDLLVNKNMEHNVIPMFRTAD